MLINKQMLPLLLSAVMGFSAFSTSSLAQGVDAGRLSAADQEPGSWLAHGRTNNEQRFSPLTEINGDTVEDLGLGWFHQFETKRGLEATPIMVDGTLYVTGTWSRVYAFDAESGALKWSYDPQVDRDVAPHLCCDAVNRGVAVWEDRVVVGTLDGRLIALNIKNGKKLWDVQTTNTQQPYSITGAPRIVKGKVIIGNGGAEYGVRGYVSAYDVSNGDMLWRFYTVPGNPAIDTDATTQKAAQSWTGEWWKLGGGGTVWDSFTYDPELDLLYIGVGNGSPWSQRLRSPQGGDNLYLSSIVALRPDTGEYVWHYQTTPGEEWDYTATQHMILADLKIDGQDRKVIMQAPKNGFFYVLDRTNGEFISAQNYIDVNWAKGIDQETGRPIENPEARYSKSGKPFMASPSPFGGHSWQPMSFNPDTGLVYFPTRTMGFPYIDDLNFKANPMAVNLGVDTVAAAMPEDPEVRKAIRAATTGRLVAWDPLTQKEVWGVDQPIPWNGGTLSTAGGLVFQGDAKGYLKAFDAQTGAEKWSYFTQTGIIAPPITYRLNGEQYVAVMAGWGGALPMVVGEVVKGAAQSKTNRLLVFKLEGNQVLPELYTERQIINAPENTASEAQLAEGKALYHTYCGSCHGDTVVSGGITPDLRYASANTFNVWDAIVLYGLRRDQGMASFASMLKEEQSAAIRSYVIKRAHDEKNQTQRVTQETP